MRRLALVVLLMITCSGCSSGARERNQEITVFAASSLTDAFGRLADEFEQSHSGTSIRVNLSSSSELAAQIEQGANADVFASADTANVDRIVDANLATGDPEVFAHNHLALIVPPDNPGHVESLEDLQDDKLVTSLCNEDCPAGIYASQLLDKAGLSVSPDSLETEVRGVVTRVATGEADAGIVYGSDAAAAGDDVRTIQIPESDNVTATYPVLSLKEGPPIARDFVDLLLSSTGQRTLGQFGFLPR
jgi:molybdate transport system substrate-binding protein